MIVQKFALGARGDFVDFAAKEKPVHLAIRRETAAEIVNYASANNIDLIVMGTHGKSNLAHILMGDTADKVLQKAHCPVMAIPSRKR